MKDAPERDRGWRLERSAEALTPQKKKLSGIADKLKKSRCAVKLPQKLKKENV